MHKRYTAVLALIALGAALAQARPAQAQAYRKPPPATQLKLHAARALTPSYIMKHMVTPAKRRAAAARAVARGLVPAADRQKGARPNALTPNAPPDYFGPYPNYANSPLPTVDPVTGHVTSGGIRKFIDSLAGVGSANANDLGNYIPTATPDTTTYPGSDYYVIALKRYTQKLHTDLPATELQGYVQLNNGTDANGNNTIVPPSRPYYLGPMIVARRNTPVRVKFINMLPTGSGGNLFLPVDTTIMGAGDRPQGWRRAVHAEPRHTSPARWLHAVDQRRNAIPVDHSGGREHLLPQGRQCAERPRHARSGPWGHDVLLHQRAERPADVDPRPRGRRSPGSTCTPARRRLTSCRTRPSRDWSAAGPSRRRDPAGHPGQDVRAGRHPACRRGPDLGQGEVGRPRQPVVPARLHAEPEPG